MTRRASLLLPLALWLLLAGTRVLAPSTLDDKDQPKVAFYTSDIVARGEWLLQHSDGVDVATKPPLYQWTAAAISIAAGRLNDFTLLLPSLLSSLAILFIVWDWGREFGRRAEMGGCWTGARNGPEEASEISFTTDCAEHTDGSEQKRASAAGYELACLSALVWAATYHVVRLEWTARTDMMVTAFGLGAIWASNRLQSAREAGAGSGRRALWRWTFWGLIALGALTKGQVAAAVALGAVGVEAAFRKSWRPLTDLWPWFGLPIAAGVFALWFNAAWLAGGQAFWDTLIGNELLARVAGTGERAQNARPVWYFLPIFVGRFLPWSVALLLAAPRWWRDGLLRPRRRHPFLLPAAWTIGILLVFSIPKGKRPDYILPAFAPAAILVAALLGDWLRRGWAAFGCRGKGVIYEETRKHTKSEGDGRIGRLGGLPARGRFLGAVFAATVLGIGGYFFFGSEAARSHDADRTRRFGLKAYALIQQDPGPILYCDSKSSLAQFYLRTNQTNLTIEDTAAALARMEKPTEAAGEPPGGPVGGPGEGPAGGPVYVVTRASRVETLEKALATMGGKDATETIPLTVLLSAPREKEDRAPLTLLRWEGGGRSKSP